MRSHLARKVNTCVLNMPMNEGTGHPHDSSGNGNNGTTTGAVWVHGSYGYGLYFDGLDDFVDCGAGTSFDITEAITVMAWVKVANPSGNYEGIVHKYDYPYGYTFRIKSDKKIYFALYDGIDGHYLTSTNTVNWDQWYHIVETWDGSVMRVYMNGAVDPTTNIFNGNIINDITRTLQIGAGYGNGELFNGTITRPYLDSRAWTAAEILAEYNASKGVFGL